MLELSTLLLQWLQCDKLKRQNQFGPTLAFISFTSPLTSPPHLSLELLQGHSQWGPAVCASHSEVVAGDCRSGTGVAGDTWQRMVNCAWKWRKKRCPLFEQLMYGVSKLTSKSGISMSGNSGGSGKVPSLFNRFGHPRYTIRAKYSHIVRLRFHFR